MWFIHFIPCLYKYCIIFEIFFLEFFLNYLWRTHTYLWRPAWKYLWRPETLPMAHSGVTYGAQKIYLWRTGRCTTGKPVPELAIPCLAVAPSLPYLWRTAMCVTDNSTYLWRPDCAPQIGLTTDGSLVAHRLCATDNSNMCATGRLFCTSVGILTSTPISF